MPHLTWRPKRRLIAAWAVYDTANTLFYAGIAGIFFPLWVTQELGADDADFGYTLSAAMAVVLVLAPLLGGLSDRMGRRHPFLILGTAVGVAALVAIRGDALFVALGTFALAFVAFNLAGVFYNALLADVSTERSRGTISGLGTGVGYIGAVGAVGIGIFLVDAYGYVVVFRVLAGLILLLSLPLLLVRWANVSEQYRAERKAENVFSETAQAFRRLREFPALTRFLVARFWYVLTVHTVSVFVVLYATQSVGLSELTVQAVLIVGMVVAIPSGLLWGILVDRIGPNRAMRIVLPGWVLLLLVGIAIPVLELHPALWWPIGVLSGVLVAGVWAADRPFMLRVAAPEHLGESFGLHSMTGRLAAIVGPASWGLVTVTLGLGQIAAMLVLVGSLLIGLVLVWNVDRRHPAQPSVPLVMEAGGDRA